MKPSRKALIKRADQALSKYVRVRDMACVLCGKVEGPQCGHLITRSCHSVRWDERNVAAQCPGCNYRHEFQPHHFTLWWVKKYGTRAYDKLVRDSNKPHKFSEEELRGIAEKYDEKTQDLLKLRAKGELF